MLILSFAPPRPEITEIQNNLSIKTRSVAHVYIFVISCHPQHESEEKKKERERERTKK